MDPFPDTVINEIAEAIGVTAAAKRGRLARYLRQLPADLSFFRSGNSVLEPARVRDRLNRIETACEKVMSVGDKASASRLEGLLARAQDGVWHLLRWQCALRLNRTHPEAALADGSAQSALDKAQGDPAKLAPSARAARIRLSRATARGHGGDRHKEDWALDQAVLLLGTLYFEVTGRHPGISSDSKSGEPTGRFLDYLTLCLEQLGYTFKPDALRSLYRRVRNRYPKDKILNPTD